MAHRKPRHVGVSPDPDMRHKTRMALFRWRCPSP